MSVTILDGGMGQELIARAGKATPLWSVQALVDAPEVVREVHDEYFAAGADVATTNSYGVLPDRFEAYDMPGRLEEFARLACQLAVDARAANRFRGDAPESRATPAGHPGRSSRSASGAAGTIRPSHWR